MLDGLIRRLGRLRDDTHAAVAINVGEQGAHTEVVSVSDELTPEELEKQDGEPLPERTQMSVLYPSPSTGMPVGVEDLPKDLYPAPTPGPVED